jgi:hypothetical protein
VQLATSAEKARLVNYVLLEHAEQLVKGFIFTQENAVHVNRQD